METKTQPKIIKKYNKPKLSKKSVNSKKKDSNIDKKSKGRYEVKTLQNQKRNTHKTPIKNSLNEKLDLIISNQNKILSKEDEIQELEKQDLAQDIQVTKSEEETLSELAKIEAKLNSSITKPLKLVTKRDIFKGFIGSFVGVMGHFAFSKAADIADTLSIYQTSILYIVAAVIIVIMLYYTGFRSIEKQIVLKFMPLRAVTLYTVSIFTIIFVNILFGKIHFPLEFIEIYKIVGASIILAVMGAGTADLLGKVESH